MSDKPKGLTCYIPPDGAPGLKLIREACKRLDRSVSWFLWHCAVVEARRILEQKPKEG